ncbi:hypothetical protein IMAU80597_02900 [Lactiplantibacillus plantarum]|nr:hypothetical protein [Lactiplantibacillus plantarum]MCG0733925.1 hypothetical protein [Lactiplantibacillus plantarum]
MSNSAQDRFLKLEHLLNNGTHFNIKNTSEFNNSIDHIVGLLTDSFTLIKQNSYGSAVFLAITAMEETAKTHYALYMKHNLNIKNSKDPMMKHAYKHVLSVSPVFKVGERLPKVIGAEKVDEIISMVDQHNGLMDLRNNAIYWYTDKKGAHFPKDSINKKTAQEILLFSIESFDDNLVGYSSYSMKVSADTDAIFQSITKDYSSKETIDESVVRNRKYSTEGFNVIDLIFGSTKKD